MRQAIQRLRRARAQLRAASGWRLHLALFILGAFGVLAHAPTFIFPAYIIAVTGLVWALDDARRSRRPVRAGLARGWSFGAGQFLAGTAWVANAFLVSAGDHAWLIWAPLIVLPAGLALFWAAAAGLYVRLARPGPTRILVFVAAVMAMEWLRSVILSGFPWNLPGHVFVAGGAVSQSAALFGVYGLSVLALYAAASPAVLFGPGRLPARLAPALIAGLCLTGAWAYGAHRLSSADVIATDVRLQLVQLNIPQREKRYARRYEILDQYLALSAVDESDPPAAVIWPEGAVPAFLLSSPALLTDIHDALPDGTRLLTGTPRADLGPDRRPVAFYNALAALRMGAEAVEVEALYDKARLVPFGESNPVEPLTRALGFGTLLEWAPAYAPGAGARTLTLDGLPPFAPLICYEVIYPRFAPRGMDRPQWLLNVSNDSWYGNSAGPQQLLNQAQYRAIEEGLPLVRSAAAGISGQIDPYGRMINRISSESTEVLNITLIEGLDGTPYSRYGNASFVIVLLLLAAITLCSAVVANTNFGGARLPREGR